MREIPFVNRQDNIPKTLLTVYIVLVLPIEHLYSETRNQLDDMNNNSEKYTNIYLN